MTNKINKPTYIEMPSNEVLQYLIDEYGLSIVKEGKRIKIEFPSNIYPAQMAEIMLALKPARVWPVTNHSVNFLYWEKGYY